MTESLIDIAANVESFRTGRTGQRITRALSPLWVASIGVLCLVLGYLVSPVFTPLFSRAGVWLPYLLLGTLFPGVLAVIVVAHRRGYRAPKPWSLIGIVVSFVGVVIFAGPIHALVAMGVAQLQTAVCAVILRKGKGARRDDLLTLLGFSFFAWVVCLELLTWDGIAAVIPPSWPLFVIGTAVSIATCWWMFGDVGSVGGAGSFVARLLNVVAIAVIAAAAFRTDGLFMTDGLGEDGTFHHWGAFVGAADAVRQGGWLLWDVPSLYGFLSPLVLAVFPASSTWQSLYLLNGLLTTLLGIWMYLRVRAVHPSVFGSLFALGAVVIVVFLSIYPPLLSPQHYFPQSGAYRFVWCYVLIGVLAWECQDAVGSRGQRQALILGTVCWVLSALWSAESAVYGTVIWLPAFAIIVFRDHLMSEEHRNWKVAVTWVLFPPLLLTAVSAVIVLFYRRNLGQGPDFQAYFEAVLAFSNTTVSDITGLYDPTSFARTIAVGVLVVFILAAASVALAGKGNSLRFLPLACGSAFGVWALLSYPVGEVFQFAIYRIMPFMILVMAVLLSVALPGLASRGAPPWIGAFRATFVTILATLLTTTIANASALETYLHAIRTEPFIGTDVTAGLPTVDPSLESLLVEAGVRGDDHIFYAGSDFGNLMPKWAPAESHVPVTDSQQWLTGQPVTMVFLSDLRKQVYLARAAERQSVGGWLVERRQSDSVIFGIGDWFFQQIARTHFPAKIAENEVWRVTRYEPVITDSPEDVTLRVPQGHPSLPTEFLINGEPLAGSVFPEIWGYFGPEWSPLVVSDQGGQCAPGNGSLYVYTPSSLKGSLAVGFLRGSDPTVLSMSANGDAPVPMRLTRNGKVEADLTLHDGWNEISVGLLEASPDALSVSTNVLDCNLNDPAQQFLEIKSVDLRFRR